MSNSEEEEEEKDTVLPLNKDLTIGLDMTALFWSDFWSINWSDKIPIYSSGNDDLPFLVFFHGAGLTGMSITAAAKILNKVYKVFAFDFRGHGLNRDIENRYHLDVDSLIDDGRQVIEFIRQNYGHNHKIVFMGHSMGGAIASKLAMQEQQNHQPVSAVLLIDIVEAAIESFDNNDRYIQNIPSSFLSYEDAIVWAIESQTIKSIDSARFSTPSQLYLEDNCYKWRVELSKTKDHWKDWFLGMNAAFLNLNCPKLLIMAGPDRLDDTMNRAWHQGLLKYRSVSNSGHSVHEDNPVDFSNEVLYFLKLFKI